MRNLILTASFFSILLLASCTKNPATESASLSTRDVVLENIHSRKSVRHFVAGKTVSQEDLTALVKAGMAAPSAVDKRPWHFVVVEDRAILDSLQAGLPYAKMLEQASAAIIVCGDTTIQVEKMSFWQFDCSAAAENILLAAEGMGLGGVWTAVYPAQDRIDHVKKVLNIPTNVIPLNLIPIGYPTGEDKPKDKFDATRVHNNKW